MPQSNDAFDRIRGSAFKKREDCSSVVLRGSVARVASHLFSDSSHDFQFFTRSESKATDLQISKWMPGSPRTGGFRSRVLTYKTPMSFVVGPPSTRVREENFMSFTSGGGAIIETHAHAQDVPGGDLFRVELYFELLPNNNRERTILRTSVAVHFSGSTMLKSIIKSSVKSESSRKLLAYPEA
eukprot:CAMPEP_0174890816 /NCGR_PEP_ID=MMETSP0167-20121228/5925_1 /TAXON_ID=38298 /ORGANISM="Rhodella maculata, Strain CCMP736" /LENGTH=182 /DNA_ID=CAMNT_0016128757 /DNA_START=96 /DNA_END=641 /DNA_ORIENTATION=-